ncbi:MAG: alkaline phosphatase family protein [Elainellaceae cyanobacterium]
MNSNSNSSSQQIPVIAIGLESASLSRIEAWMSQGHLSNLRRLKQEGAYGYLNHIDHYATETEWTTFLTGCLPTETGYWRPLDFNPATYDIGEPVRPYDFADYPPFYALGDQYRVSVFDMPQVPLSNEVNGVQVSAWGAQDPQVSRGSRPSHLIDTLIATHGEHPAFMKCFGDNWWDQDYLEFLADALNVGISRRSAICRDLLRREPWDLFLTVFSEPHSAGHNFWHLSQSEHPMHAHRGNAPPDPLLATFQAIDQALGEILSVVSDHAYVLVFSCLGMESNANEVPSMVFLPELLYRFNFPGRVAIAGDTSSEPPPPVIHPNRRKWSEEVWQRRHDPNPITRVLRRNVPNTLYHLLSKLDDRWQMQFHANEPGLTSVNQLYKRGVRLAWQPTSWYQPLWSTMQAFALPSFSDGLIRINLKGREAQGIVDPENYDALCDTLIRHLYDLRDSRTQEPAVRDIIRTRSSPMDANPKYPDADLIVLWSDRPMDVVDSPEFGRIGPVPYRRSGGHQNGGFLMARGPGIAPHSTLPHGHVIDLAPTILNLMGAPIPDYLDGTPLLNSVKSFISCHNR